MKVLIGCEYTQIVTEAFALAGHEVLSCDYERAEKNYPHYRGDIRDLLNENFDLGIFFPPCTYLCKPQIFRLRKEPGRAKKALEAYRLVKTLYNSNIPRVAIENPEGLLQKWFRPYDQQIQPWQFGDIYSKEICLWLRGLPRLKSTEIVIPTKTMKNHTNGRMTQKQIGLIKSRFYPGIAAAMAEQWGSLSDALNNWQGRGQAPDKPGTTRLQAGEDLQTTGRIMKLF